LFESKNVPFGIENSTTKLIEADPLPRPKEAQIRWAYTEKTSGLFLAE
jgi:hypothetical protein